MVLAAFGMRGSVPLPFSQRAPFRYCYARQDTMPAPSPAGVGLEGCKTQLTGRPTAGHLIQGEMREAGRAITSAATAAVMTAEPRTLLTGWVDLPPLPQGQASGASAIQDLQHLLDEGGAAAVRRLRGDFVIAHLARDGSALHLYRGATSLIPLFWRLTSDSLTWSTNPVDLLDTPEPRLQDVERELLPMIVAEMGFPRDRSWFTDVRRLPTGESASLAAGASRPMVRRFDELSPLDIAPSTVREAAEGLRERLATACSRMLSDERSAVLLLSGGVDSAAVAHEVGQQCRDATGLHFTLGGFPNFDDDRSCAEAVATSCGLTLAPYDMARHVGSGGDYLERTTRGALPQTHVPQPGAAVAAEHATRSGASFVLSGLLADQVLADDQHRGLFAVAGWSMLNPLVAGEPVWQTLQEMATASFPGATGSGTTGGGTRALGLLRSLLSADPTAALPGRDMMVHPVGLTAEAADQVTQAIATSARRADLDLRSATQRRRRWHGPPPGITSLFYLKSAFDTPNLQAAWLNQYLPRRRFFATPYADRDVIEYALALPTSYRIGFGYGVTVDKFALRVAYANRGLPLHVGRRMNQARVDAIPGVFARENFDTCQRLLGPGSLLRDLGIVSEHFVRGLTRDNVHRNGEKVARLCALEQWLRGVTG